MLDEMMLHAFHSVIPFLSVILNDVVMIVNHANRLFLRGSAIGRRRRDRCVGIGRRRGSASSGISAGSPMMLSRGPPSAIVRLGG